MAKKAKVKDESGQIWRIAIEGAEPEHEEADEEMVVRFVPEDDEELECEIRVLGPMLEEFPDLEPRELRLALDAARSGVGFLFLDRDEHLWWVQTPDEDPVAEDVALTFTRFTDELRHPGPLPGAVEDLTEDEIQELLDETLGRVIG